MRTVAPNIDSGQRNLFKGDFPPAYMNHFVANGNEFLPCKFSVHFKWSNSEIKYIQILFWLACDAHPGQTKQEGTKFVQLKAKQRYCIHNPHQETILVEMHVMYFKKYSYSICKSFLWWTALCCLRFFCDLPWS